MRKVYLYILTFVFLIACSVSPVQAANAFDPGAQKGIIELTIENSTFPDGNFTGMIYENKNFPIGENDTMMTCVLRALNEKGFTWEGTGAKPGDKNGYSITYLAQIVKDRKKLGEFSGDPGSGWMGTLNDWFVNESFQAFTVKNGLLESGDAINVMFTQNLGVDIGGTWGNSNTKLKDLKVEGASLKEVFNPDKKTYSLPISGNNAEISIIPVNANKNFLSRMFLNEMVKEDKKPQSFFKRTQKITVKSGDVIYVGVGENAWPSMNKQGAEARYYEPTWYQIKVMQENDSENVNANFQKLNAESVNLENYRDIKLIIEEIEASISMLSEEAKARISADDLAKLDEFKTKVSKYEKLDKIYKGESVQYDYNEVIDWIKELTVSTTISLDNCYRQYSVATKIKKAYDGLSSDKDKVNNIEKLTEHIAKAEFFKQISEVIKRFEGLKLIEKVKIAHENMAKTAFEMYEKLSEEQKAYISKDDVDLCKNILAEIAKLKGGGGNPSNPGGTGGSGNPGGGGGGGLGGSGSIGGGGTGIGTGNKTNENGVKTLVDNFQKETLHNSEVNIENAVKSFRDVKKADWYASAVGFVKSKGIMAGASNDKFEPATKTSRAMLVSILYRLDGSRKVDGALGLKDVNAGEYYADATNWALQKKVVSGYQDNTFKPNENISRQQIAVILMNYAKMKGLYQKNNVDLNKFKDQNEIASYAKDAVMWANDIGIIQGKSGDTLDPNGEASRAEVAAMLMRFCSKFNI